MQIMETKQTTKMRIATGLLLICVLAAALSGCNTQIQAADLMAGDPARRAERILPRLCGRSPIRRRLSAAHRKFHLVPRPTGADR